MNYLQSLKRDHKKLEWLKINDFELIEIEENKYSYEEFIREIENLRDEIIQMSQKRQENGITTYKACLNYVSATK